jgi:hypothetical protein
MPSHARWITEIEQLTDIDKFNAAPLLVHALADFVRKEVHSAVGAAHDPASRWRPCYIALTLADVADPTDFDILRAGYALESIFHDFNVAFCDCRRRTADIPRSTNH